MFEYEYWGNGSFNAYVNMALEEYLLKRAIKKVAPIRFWDFSKDSAVLGYGQATDAIKKVDDSFNVVRRITGGSHVQTGKNILAYTFAVPRDGSFRTFEDLRAYYADIVAKGLEDIGIKGITVDNKASTINVDGKIIASHSIIWGVESALIHGLILIDPYDVEKVNERMILGQRKMGASIYTEYNAIKKLPAISQLLKNVAPNLDEARRSEVLKDLIAKAVLKRVTKNYELRKITDQTIMEALGVKERKYSSESWIGERKLPFEKEEIEDIPGEELKGELKKNQGYCLFSQVKNKDFKEMAEPDD